MRLGLLYLLAVQAAPLTFGLLLPNLTGPYPVGTVSIELLDKNREDVFAPSPQPRDLMISLFYPTDHGGNYTHAPSFTPKLAHWIDLNYGVPEGLAESIVSQAYVGAPIRRTQEPLPVVLFSPGFGGMRQEYTALVSNVASHGYLAVAVDHPYDTSFVEYPDGRTAESNHTRQTPDYPGGTDVTVYMRVADLIFVLDSLSSVSVTSQIPGAIDRPLATGRVCAFGHSLGGAAAVQATLNDTRFACAVNMDGALWGSSAQEGTDRPVMIMASAEHPPGSIASWVDFWPRATSGLKRLVRIAGTTHPSFIDYPAVIDGLGPGLVPPELRAMFGSIGGERMFEVTSAYTLAFLGRVLKKGGGCDGGKLLDGDSAEFPEVTFGNSDP